MLKILSLSILVIFVINYKVNSSEIIKPTKTVKNIILLIGDGMGVAQLSTLFYLNQDESSFRQFKHIGFHQNQSIDSKITDSAAGATAFSIGFKTYNGAVGVDADTISRQTILETAAEMGKSTGIISTSSITDATPASFYAHVKSRRMSESIAVQLAKSQLDFFAGGGYKDFIHRLDGKNYLEIMKSNGVYIDTISLSKKSLKHGIRYGFLLAKEEMPKMQSQRENFLPEATELAINHLSQNEKGFFLMVEGGQIDNGGHENDADYVIEEMKDFDIAVGVALDFAKLEKNTLVVVTADHETGGLALTAAKDLNDESNFKIDPTFSTNGHTACLIPVFSYGPSAEDFTGIYENNEIYYRMMRWFTE
ncbi:MAG: alkaline phosphatase [Cyclobacteriaceae bacterium]|nr:MAG: alkaline phosphatase [Cyclobacteriaceae bacterium]